MCVYFQIFLANVQTLLILWAIYKLHNKKSVGEGNDKKKVGNGGDDDTTTVTSNEVKIVGGDGIEVDFDDGEYTISTNVEPFEVAKEMVLAGKGIELTQDQNAKTMTVSVDLVNLVEPGENVAVTATGEDGAGPLKIDVKVPKYTAGDNVKLEESTEEPGTIKISNVPVRIRGADLIELGEGLKELVRELKEPADYAPPCAATLRRRRACFHLADEGGNDEDNGKYRIGLDSDHLAKKMADYMEPKVEEVNQKIQSSIDSYSEEVKRGFEEQEAKNVQGFAEVKGILQEDRDAFETKMKEAAEDSRADVEGLRAETSAKVSELAEKTASAVEEAAKSAQEKMEAMETRAYAKLDEVAAAANEKVDGVDASLRQELQSQKADMQQLEQKALSLVEETREEYGRMVAQLESETMEIIRKESETLRAEAQSLYDKSAVSLDEHQKDTAEKFEKAQNDTVELARTVKSALDDHASATARQIEQLSEVLETMEESMNKQGQDLRDIVTKSGRDAEDMVSSAITTIIKQVEGNMQECAERTDKKVSECEERMRSLLDEQDKKMRDAVKEAVDSHKSQMFEGLKESMNVALQDLEKRLQAGMAQSLEKAFSHEHFSKEQAAEGHLRFMLNEDVFGEKVVRHHLKKQGFHPLRGHAPLLVTELEEDGEKILAVSMDPTELERYLTHSFVQASGRFRSWAGKGLKGKVSAPGTNYTIDVDEEFLSQKFGEYAARHELRPVKVGQNLYHTISDDNVMTINLDLYSQLKKILCKGRLINVVAKNKMKRIVFRYDGTVKDLDMSALKENESGVTNDNTLRGRLDAEEEEEEDNGQELMVAKAEPADRFGRFIDAVERRL